MSPAERKKKLAGLRVALAFASKAHRPAIQAMIDELLADWPDDQPVTIEAAPAPSIPAPVMGPAGQDGECPGPKGQTTPSAGGEPSPFVTRAAGAGSRRCTTCQRDFMPNSRRQRYCAPECQQHRPAKYPRSAQQKAERRNHEAAARARQLDAAAAAAPVEFRQTPRRPVWHLEWHPEIVIGRGRPAPMKRYSNGMPCEFQDDLDAIADHGSPGSISRAVNAPIGVSTLGFV